MRRNKKRHTGIATLTDAIATYTTHFRQSSDSHPYNIVTPDTPLEVLETFFLVREVEFALVTDAERKWVLAVATRSDLEVSGREI